MFLALTRRFKSMTIRRRFTLLVLTAVILILSVFSLMRAKNMIDAVHKDLEIKRESAIELGVLSIADPLWNLHGKGITAVGDALFKDPEVGLVIVRDISKGTVYDRRISDSAHQPEHLIVSERDIVRNDKTIGIMTIGVTTYYRDEIIQQDLMTTTASSLLLVIILWFMISFVSHLVTKPIYELSEGASEIARGNLSKRLHIDYDDEIGHLGQKFNLMAENLHNMVTELAEKNLALIQEANERRQVQTWLAASEEKFAKAFRYASDVIGIISLPEQKFIELSQTFFHIFGYDRAQVIGHSSDEFSLWQNKEQRDAIYNLLHLDKAFRNQEVTWLTHSGEERVGLCSAEVIDIAQRPHIIFVWHDITERKQTEDALRQAHDQLEQKVEIRTQELTAVNQELRAMNEEQASTLALLKAMQRQLIESEKMAALGNLVAGVAHEINTPVGVGVTAASHLVDVIHEIRSLAADGRLTRSGMNVFLDDAAESGQMVLKNLERAANLVRSFKQVSVDQSREIKRLFNLKTYMEDIIRSLHPELKKTNHSVTIDCPDDLAIDNFPGAFAQIATNLLMNSLIHAYDPGDSGQIRFTLGREKEQILLRYSDDGKGIEGDTLDKIFDPFFTTRRGDGSTGLGLHIVYNIVTQKLHGNIQCQSHPGHGVLFSISFPAMLPDN